MEHVTINGTPDIQLDEKMVVIQTQDLKTDLCPFESLHMILEDRFIRTNYKDLMFDDEVIAKKALETILPLFQVVLPTWRMI
ncbi:hypothetical protein KAR91_28115 [Candidatus Pacearchaeota archaeon]|nr:hypothetical protein [Candidatus Pacearchaeota archaeon]